MADGGGVQGDGLWLPAEFFDDFVTGKENLANNGNPDPGVDLIFPNEFPYEMQTLAAVNSGKRWGMSTSPQSTLSGGVIWSVGSAGGTFSNGSSPNGVYSPPVTPVSDVVTDLIYRAADEVAKLKLNVAVSDADPLKKTVVAPRSFSQFHYPSTKYTNPPSFQNIHLQQQKQGTSRLLYGEPQIHQIRNTGVSMEALIGQQLCPRRYSPTLISPSGHRNVPLGGSICAVAPKKGRTGTGVFIPRRYDGSSFSPDTRRKIGSCFPGRNLTGHLNDMNGFAQSRPQFEAKPISWDFDTDYDLLMARRNALLLQHPRSVYLDRQSPSPMPIGTCLPREWSY